MDLLFVVAEVSFSSILHYLEVLFTDIVEYTSSKVPQKIYNLYTSEYLELFLLGIK